MVARRATVLGWVLMVAWGAVRVHAQEATTAQHRIEGRAWLGAASVRDDTLVPLAFTGPSLALGVRYGLVAGRHMLDAELRADFGIVLNRFGHLGALIGHGVEFGYAHAIALRPERRFALGAALRWDTRIAYLAEWDDAHGYWLGSALLWPQVIDAQPIHGTTWLEARYQFAAFGLASRPPSYRYNKQDALTHPDYFVDRIGHGTRWVTLADVQGIDAEFMVRFRPSHDAYGRGWGLGLSLRFLRASFPAPHAELYTGLLISRGWGL